MSQSATFPTSSARPSAAAVLELLKPITWFAPIWAFGCGIVSSGVSLAEHWGVLLAGMLLAGPLVCGMSQAVNDWYDRHVDAINEPNRPIPSGRIPGRWGLWIAMIWTGVSLVVAAAIGPVVLMAAIVGVVLAWLYSAPPLRLKQNGWWGNAAVGLCYEGLPWFTGAAAMAGGWPASEVVILAVLYSIGAHGIMTLNDFKAVEGDRQMGVNSLPVLLGEAQAAKFACLVMTLPQLVVIALLIQWDRPIHGAIVGLFTVFQVFLMMRLLLDAAALKQKPRENAAQYNATGTTFYVLGMLTSAFAVSTLAQGGL